jgi:nucleoid DNA-binding protein
MERVLPPEVAGHLEELVASSDEAWAKEQGALSRLGDLWLEKNRLFEEQIGLIGMEFVEKADAEDPRGMILTTYSGSLVALGPGSPRKLEYASIKMRSDVPDVLRNEGVEMTGAAAVGSKASFSGTPLKNTSAIYRIAILPEGLGNDEQEQRIREAMVFLTNSFVHLNRRFTYPGGDAPGQFDKKSMTKYLAEAEGLTQKAVTALLDDYAVLLETGMLMGHTVSLGRLGRLSLAVKPARKARMGRNPATGEEILIPAKDAHMAPRIKFSSRIVDRAANLPLEDAAEGD